MQPDGSDWGRPLYERVLDAVGPVSGGPLLDVGCGTGWLCRLASARGISVTGVDPDPAALAQAARLVPEAELLLGALPGLPVADRSAGAVTCVQVLMHLPDPLAALRELARAARAGAPVVVTVWGPAEECAIGAFGRALAPLLDAPPHACSPTGWADAARPPPHRAGPPPLHAAGRLAKLAQLAGLQVERMENARCPIEYADAPTLLADLYAADLGRRAVAAAGRARVRRAVLAGLEPYQRSDGGYRLENTFRLLIARAR